MNIIIVNFGLLVFKIDDPKAFCQGEADYPIVTYVPRGVEHIEEYAPHGKDTRYFVTGAIYGLIQASLRYFLRASDVLEGLGFIQCDYAKTIFIKHLSRSGISSCFGSTWTTDGAAHSKSRICYGSYRHSKSN